MRGCSLLWDVEDMWRAAILKHVIWGKRYTVSYLLQSVCLEKKVTCMHKVEVIGM